MPDLFNGSLAQLLGFDSIGNVTPQQGSMPFTFAAMSPSAPAVQREMNPFTPLLAIGRSAPIVPSAWDAWLAALPGSTNIEDRRGDQPLDATSRYLLQITAPKSHSRGLPAFQRARRLAASDVDDRHCDLRPEPSETDADNADLDTGVGPMPPYLRLHDGKHDDRFMTGIRGTGSRPPPLLLRRQPPLPREVAALFAALGQQDLD